MSRPSWAPEEVDPSKPSVARVYDFYLGGSHNFESDREFGRQTLSHFPGLRQVLLDNRVFLRRVVLFLVAQGVDQFLDLGSGIPTVGNVHEVAQGVEPAGTGGVCGSRPGRGGAQPRAAARERSRDRDRRRYPGAVAGAEGRREHAGCWIWPARWRCCSLRSCISSTTPTGPRS